MSNVEFENVDIAQFFDFEKVEEESIRNAIVILTPPERELVEELARNIEGKYPEHLANLNRRIKNLEILGAAIARFPSLMQRHTLTFGERTPDALIDSLITYQEDGDTILHLPSKATLGKGFLISKIHTFDALYRIAKSVGMDEKFVTKIENATVSMTFLLLAEDVYLNLIRDKSLEEDFRRHLGLSLLLLWEHRTDQNVSDIAPVLQSVWNARRTLAPAFGTMVGTSELLLFSIQLDESWSKFIKARLSDPDVTQSMEEFLFGLSYEQITTLRGILRKQEVKAIGRDEVSKFLGQRVKTDIGLDYRDFYLLYTVRRDNARVRQRLGHPGPKKTLEDHFISFNMQMDKEKQVNDAVATAEKADNNIEEK